MPDGHRLSDDLGLLEHQRASLLSGRWVRLRPIAPDDYDALFELALHPESLARWRYRGVTPSPESFVQSLYHDVFLQFVADRPASGEIVGHLTAHALDAKNGHASISNLIHPESRGTSVAMEGTMLFTHELFRTWNLRKLYGQIPAFNLEQIESGLSRLFVEEGRLRDHEYFNGRYWDLVHVAVYRPAFYERHAHHIARLLRGGLPSDRLAPDSGIKASATPAL